MTLESQILQDMYTKATWPNSGKLSLALDFMAKIQMYFNKHVLNGLFLKFSAKGSRFSHAGKRFELNFFKRKTLVKMGKPARQNNPHSWPLCPVPGM